MIGTRDLKALLRAQDITERLSANGEASVHGLEPAIDLARGSLEAQLGRRRYLLEMLPDTVAYTLPGLSGVFSFSWRSQAASNSRLTCRS